MKLSNLFGQNDYEKLWKSVEKNESKGLPKSALDTVNLILEKAKKEQHTGQYIKSLIHIVKFNAQVEEEGLVNGIMRFQKETENASYPAKPILQTILADFYWQYYEQNRYLFYNRTTVQGEPSSDIRTWDLNTLQNKITALYLASLQDKEKLKQTPVDGFPEVIMHYHNNDMYAPTLFDFLAQRALLFFTNEERAITKPIYEFEVSNLTALADPETFVQTKFDTPDKESLKYQALLLYQEAIAFHAQDQKPTAFIEWNLRRLTYTYRITFNENKDDAYLNTLQKLAEKHVSNHDAAQIQYYIGLHIHAHGITQNGLNPAQQAAKIYQEAISKYPENCRGVKNCSAALHNLKQSELSIQAEHQVAPNNPFKILLSAKNLASVYIKIVSLDSDPFKFKNDYDDYDDYEQKKIIKFYLKQTQVHFFKTDIPFANQKDYQTHSAEIKIPALPKGRYAILVSADKDFSLSKNNIQYATFWVTNICAIVQNMYQGGENTIRVLHAQTGKPMPNANVQFMFREYNYNKRRYEYKKGKTYTTNAEGNIPLSYAETHNMYGISLYITAQNDVYFSEKSLYLGGNIPEKYSHNQTYFFTDRAIYRPGQTIYFKALCLHKPENSDIFEIRRNESVTVNFYDVNHQLVSKLDLRTNDYGTVNGTFTAPMGVLNGNMHLTDGNGSHYFSVEEYKRPKFEVNPLPITQSYRLGDKITVITEAKSYAGGAVTDAKVQYRVVRQPQYPRWCWWWGPYPATVSKEITHGIAKTNNKGQVEIVFEASPDKSIDKSRNPIFTYTVYVDVTDLNGETRSTLATVKVGYTAITLSSNIQEKINRDKNEGIKIYTENLNGQHENTIIRYALVPLPKKEKAFRERLWEEPTDFLMTKNEYYASFPYDVYQHENQYRLDELKLPDNAITIENKSGQSLSIPFNTLNSGAYALIVEAKDKYGTPIRYEKEYVIYSEKETQVSGQKIFYTIPLHTSGLQPNDKAKIIIGSALPDAVIEFQIEHKGKTISKQLISLNQSQKVLEIPITENMRGGLTVHLSMVHQYRLYQESIAITVPWDNKKLDLKWSTFRNKLLPGQKEEWRLTVSDKNGEKIMAEMLAGMYDASLDVFRANSWGLSLFPYYGNQSRFESYGLGLSQISVFEDSWHTYLYGESLYDDYLNYYGLSFYWNRYGNVMTKKSEAKRSQKNDDGLAYMEAEKSVDEVEDVKKEENKPSPTVSINGKSKAGGEKDREEKKQAEVKVRTNLNETAFFYPQVQTNEKGEYVLSFTIPEALTKWKFMALAHTQDLKIGTLYDEVITQKELMVQPNAPRFFRETDIMEFPAKITNLSNKTLTGKAKIALFDATTLKPIEQLCQVSATEQDFTLEPGQNKGVSWKIVVPAGISAITHRVVAVTNEFSDGEEAIAPVVTDKLLVTESLPLPVRGKEKKKFTFSKLISQNNGSNTLRNHKFTLEFTSNPAWYAVQALPYLIEFPYECTEQIFSRYYANSIATHIANSHPKIKAVFDRWATEPDSKALLSNLEKNQELKSALLEETPWVLEGKDETERKKRIAILFDLNRMSYELSKALKTIKERQTPNGGFTWFPGMPDNPWMTQHIIAGFGHLKAMNVNTQQYGSSDEIIQKAIPYIDARMYEHYQEIKKYAKNMNDDHLSYYAVHYLYTRSYFTQYKLDKKYEEAFNYFTKQTEKYWTSRNIMLKGMIALACYRFAQDNSENLPKTNAKLAQDIMKSIKEHAIYNEEMGMYFKENTSGYYWYQAPIETQALMIECFDEVSNDQKSVEELKIWLLKQKQTQDWKTTKATTEACYALLRRGINQLLSDEIVEVTLGSMTVTPEKTEAGTGYFKTSWQGTDIKPEMGNITVHKKDEGIAWGAVYWQYFEQMDKITPHETPLKLKKQLFIERVTDKGKVLEPITETTPIQVGDVVKVRIELRSDRDMEYIHLKDMRASGFEPMNVISRYKYQDGLGYYESTRDIATHFFMDYLRKGTYVFEYPLRATHKGTFQNGIATIQCMYAPEFNSHSEGIKVEIK